MSEIKTIFGIPVPPPGPYIVRPQKGSMGFQFADVFQPSTNDHIARVYKEECVELVLNLPAIVNQLEKMAKDNEEAVLELGNLNQKCKEQEGEIANLQAALRVYQSQSKESEIMAAAREAIPGAIKVLNNMTQTQISHYVTGAHTQYSGLVYLQAVAKAAVEIARQMAAELNREQAKP